MMGKNRKLFWDHMISLHNYIWYTLYFLTSFVKSGDSETGGPKIECYMYYFLPQQITPICKLLFQFLKKHWVKKNKEKKYLTLWNLYPSGVTKNKPIYNILAHNKRYKFKNPQS